MTIKWKTVTDGYIGDTHKTRVGPFDMEVWERFPDNSLQWRVYFNNCEIVDSGQCETMDDAKKACVGCLKDLIEDTLKDLWG